MKNLSVLIIALFSLTTSVSLACSPCAGLSGITQTVNGNNLELTFTSNAGWQCCYNVNIELICVDATFTGVANYLSPLLCINGGDASSSTWSIPEPYALTVLDLSNLCPGTYKWRAWEVPCYIYTAEYEFTIAGSNPMQVTSSASEVLLCEGESSNLSANATNGCNGPYTYSWAPAAGLSNANIANPVATPATTTTYTVTASEPGSCGAQQTSQVTITVNPLPTATITNSVAVCQGDPSPNVTLSGASGTAPYTINYNLNGTPQTPVTTTGNDFVLPAPTNIPGTYTYTLVDITESSSIACSQNQNGTITVTVNGLPNVNAGNDQQICEPNPTSPSLVTLNGSGAISYSWSGGVVDGTAFIPPTGVNTYTVSGTDANGCINTDQVVVTAYPLPVANGSASPIYGNIPLEVTFGNSSILANSYAWDFADGNTLNTNTLGSATNTYINPGIYNVLLVASNGICYDTWTIQIEVLPPMIVTPPNVFTPNGDNANDLYFVDVQYGEYFEAIILNRWGHQINTLNTINQGWDGKTDDGKEVEDGVYFIKYKATDFNDKSIEGHTYFHLVR
ncbi:MAG: gliding motility-associated C-terminal domain-containing protein [Crocinitomicaceae bacterium]|nr:gliding motility-associated C-terminal domain-containing protein [Crocinitomicaceae bacterium]MCF8434661.1 gliding motility-associated C-terminal domain-containing protein [Crocinitomicaceae bacterium]